jgi:hypothetical protein
MKSHRTTPFAPEQLLLPPGSARATALGIRLLILIIVGTAVWLTASNLGRGLGARTGSAAAFAKAALRTTDIAIVAQALEQIKRADGHYPEPEQGGAFPRIFTYHHGRETIRLRNAENLAAELSADHYAYLSVGGDKFIIVDPHHYPPSYLRAYKNSTGTPCVACTGLFYQSDKGFLGSGA